MFLVGKGDEGLSLRQPDHDAEPLTAREGGGWVNWMGLATLLSDLDALFVKAVCRLEGRSVRSTSADGHREPALARAAAHPGQ